MSVADLRPWEYWAMDSHEYYLLTALRTAWAEGRAAFREEPEAGHGA